MVGKKGLFELKKCTVSRLKRQFDKWHLFSGSTGLGFKKESPSARGSGEARGPGSLGGPGSWYSHGQTTHGSRKPRGREPLSSRDPCPFPKRCRRGRGVPAGRGGPGSKGGRGPGSWYSSAYTVSSSVGIPRAGSPNEPGPLAFSQRSI